MALAILLLPITSLPLLSKLMGGTFVSPPTVALAGLAAAVWLPALILKRERIPQEVVPVLVFALLALAISLASLYLPLPPYKQVSWLGEMVSALATLAAGVLTYLAFATFYRKESQIRWGLALVNVAGAVMLVWAIMQTMVIYVFDGNYPPFVVAIHDSLSVRTLSMQTFQVRVTGFAYEPSWLANQLNAFFLPFWMAATITGYSAFKRRLWFLSAENILLALGVVVMLMSLSRIGIISLLLVTAYLVYHLSKVIIIWLRPRLVGRSHESRSDRLVGFGIGLGLFVIYAWLIVGLIAVLAKVDNRIAHLLDLQRLPTDLTTLARVMAFAERYYLWIMGWNVFTHFPLFGVGLGNSGFFFPVTVPPEIRLSNEMLKILTEQTFLPNTKNLWIRLLAETGMVGFSVFVSWLLVLRQTARTLMASTNLLSRTMGWMGLIALLTIIGEGFSLDSFALPYFWASFGLMTAAGFMLRHSGTPPE